jgi:hypothetical protein
MIRDLLEAIPADCSYDEWIRVGMALKQEGYDVSVWDSWSATGHKYRPGECQRKWNSFRRDEITGGTLYHIAADYGYKPPPEPVYDIHNLWLDEVRIDPSFVSPERIPGPGNNYDPRGDMLEYFTTLFEPDEFVGYCISFNSEGRPTGTNYRRTAGDIIDKLRNGTIEKAIGTTGPSGAYVRFNPLDGSGENNANVTRWKYCLIESDTDSIEKQYSLYKAMNLPITFLVHSGKKSLHAITRVDAENAKQYRARVLKLYEFCKDSGLTVDEQDKNESRFSRLPGVRRGDRWQYIVARSIGAPSYSAWEDWCEDQKDNLPPDTNLAEVWDNMPPLREELIPGILRVGHKMLLAGPSKAGKSFLLINLAISIAEGCEWIGLPCRQGRVCYVNLELDEASCFHRFREIYDRLGIQPRGLSNLDIWNLRGHAVPMDKLSKAIIHRFREKKYAALIIDPIYKVITGDENNATEMAQFCSYFDQVTAELGVSVIYCHHHSKGAAGKYANAADRSSGSGVFARDPDAILDLRELSVAGLIEKYRKSHPDACTTLTGWELNGTLREFAPMETRRIWFDYPTHVPDTENFLGVATYSNSGETGRGTGKGQTSKADWFQIVEDLLSISTDTAVSLESVGISESNAKQKFGSGTDYEVATVGDSKVVHKRSEDEITYAGKKYKRDRKGRRCIWSEL